MPPLGLIAGEGIFPLLVARGARAAGRKVVCAAFAGHAWPDLDRECDDFHWVGLLRFNQWVRHLRAGSTQRLSIEMGLAGVLSTQLWHQRFLDPGLADLAAAPVEASDPHAEPSIASVP